MKKLLIILSMTALLTHCTKLEFDGFDPTTATVRWVIKQNLNIEKDELQVKKNCQALNTSGGYISVTPSIGAFALLGVRARKPGWLYDSRNR